MLQTTCLQPERKSSLMMQLTRGLRLPISSKEGQSNTDEHKEELCERFAGEVDEGVPKGPRTYDAQIRAWNPRRSQEVMTTVQMLLLHEVAHVLHNHLKADSVLDRSGVDALTREHTESCERNARCSLLPMGLWSDGAPFNCDRSESLEIFALNLPGPTGDFKRLRLPLTGPVEQKRIHEYVRRCLGCRRVVVSTSGRWTISVASRRRSTHEFQTCKDDRPNASSARGTR